MTHTKESIQALLLRNDETGMHAVGRALLVLLANQTAYEKRTECTINRNDTGFTPNDAKRGSSMAGYYERNNCLTPAQLAYWQQPARTEKRNIRIIKYWRQMLQAAELKANRKAVQAEMQLAA